MKLEELKSDYDWNEVFGYAGDNNIEDVEEIIATDDGYNDVCDWIGIFKMKNGKYLHVWAGCDYTGWDCQSSGAYQVYDTLKDVLSKLSLPRAHRGRLKDQLTQYELDW